MVGKNNHIRTVKSNLTKHYKTYKAGRHWIYASLASLALGVGLLLGGTTSYADTTTTASQTPVNTVSADSGNGAVGAEKASTAPSKAGEKTTVSNSSNTATTSDHVTSDSSENPVKNVKANGIVPTNSSESAENSPVTASDTAAKSADDSATKVSAPAESQIQSAKPKSEQPATATRLVDPTQEQVAAAKASAEQTYAATHQPQEIDAVAPDSQASLKISTNAIGYGTGATPPLTVTLTTNAKAGDVYTITIPANTQVFSYQSAAHLVSAAGTTTETTNADGSHTITDTFTADSTTTQQIKLDIGGNYAGQDAGMPDVGKTLTKTITWTINGQAQTPVTFTQTIKPTTKLSTVTLLYPSSKEVSVILPNKNYVFALSVNEANGIRDDSWKSAKVNSADNYGGSKITIPVPTGFVLDEDSTSQINGLTDGTTITQPGGKGSDVMINVPAKAGNQGYQEVPPYKIVGAFDVPQTNTNQTLTASGDVTFSQIVNSDNDTITDKADPWRITLIANQGGTDVGNSTAATTGRGNATGTNKFVLDTDPTDDPAYLASFGFAYNSAAESSSTQFKITVPDGLDATSIQVPGSIVSPTVYLPETTSYSYTLTLADGTTETGTVNAGDKVTPNDHSAIRTAVFVPNQLAPGTNTGDNNQLGGKFSFVIFGHLSNTYDNGAPVKVNDQLITTFNAGFDASGNPITSDKSVTQTVVEAESLGVGYVSHNANWDMPGNPNAGKFQLEQGGGRGQTTYDIFEPIFYFVIPKSSTVASTNHPDGAKISEFTTDDGHTVVKFDYTGSGVTIDTHKDTGTYATVTLANKPDALPGNYPFYMYIVSPKTKIANNTPAVDPSYVENNPNAFLMGDVGSGNWTITTASSFFNTSLAQGNQNVDAITKGTSDDQGDSTLNFFDAIVYTSLADNAKDSNASVAINLPTIGDSKGSQYTFKLTGPIKVPTNYTVVDGQGAAINPTVLYSTQPQAVNDNATTPDTTGYVTADQVTDWSAIRSIVIEIKGIQANTSTGRIPISGTADNFNTLAGKIGYLQTIFYGNGAKASVNSNDASIAITGTSTIKTRFHYVDANGADQYIDLDDLSKTLNDNADTFKDDYPTKLSGFSSTDQALIPTGYKLVTDVSGNTTPTIIDGTGDGKAQFGQVTQYFYDGDFVQYELVGNVNAQVEYVDDDNNGAVVGTSTTISGTSGGTANWTANHIPTGYKLANGQAANGTYQFTNGTDQTVKIHLVHIVDQTTMSTTRTITYTGVATGNPESNSKQLNWTVATDQVTGATTYTPTGNYPEVTSPTVPGYTPDQATVAAGTDTVTTTKPSDSSVTVTYSAVDQSAKVEYVDDDNNGAVVGTPTTLTGKTSGTANWNTNNKPAGYHLAAGQAASGTYQFTNGTDQTVKIHLTHIVDYSKATTTRTINYVVDDPNYTGQVPETQTQTINWKITTDEATGETVATPQGAYYKQISPIIIGYEADTPEVAQKAYGSVTSDNLPKAKIDDVTVTYHPSEQTAQVEYVDDDNGGALVGTPTTITGVTNGTATWNTNNIPAHYVLAPGKTSSGTYIFNAGHNQPFMIHLNHKLDYTAAISTRTIHYVVDDPNYTGQPLPPRVQTVKWHVVTDEVTGASVATPEGAYYEVTVPDLPGYTANPTKVGQQALGSVAADDVSKYNENVYVTYTLTPVEQPGGNSTENSMVPTPPSMGPNDDTTTPGQIVTETPAPGKAIVGKQTEGSGNAIVTSRNAGRAETVKTANASEVASTTRTVSNSRTSSQAQASATPQRQLPQTNEQQHSEIGLGILGLLTGILGLTSLKRRKRDDE
ncbi:adhesion exoprotein [Secundilactobacillus pentosiphilus]|uniref:Adhesion exoprotein n=1 Tax=Secundilactobacillus pentosiphilus TaxID=1714682 RepID=A0A1Z5IVU0_9LACO|nr:KxYKxGKxW signal peptide domain-containing protein [Secundilactobacillus pentosiphilus]GAX05904.1 adhesion exoprotein [Secundilactobacillus pentosiphilus]